MFIKYKACLVGLQCPLHVLLITLRVYCTVPQNSYRCHVIQDIQYWLIDWLACKVILSISQNTTLTSAKSGNSFLWVHQKHTAIPHTSPAGQQYEVSTLHPHPSMNFGPVETCTVCLCSSGTEHTPGIGWGSCGLLIQQKWVWQVNELIVTPSVTLFLFSPLNNYNDSSAMTDDWVNIGMVFKRREEN